MNGNARAEGKIGLRYVSRCERFRLFKFDLIELSCFDLHCRQRLYKEPWLTGSLRQAFEKFHPEK